MPERRSLNIIIVTDVLPWPLASGGAQAQYNMIEALRHKHRVTLIFPQNGGNTPTARRELARKWPEVRLVMFPYLRQMLHWPFLRDKICRAWNLKFNAASERFQVERILKPYAVYFSRDFVSFVRREIRRQSADLVQVEFFPSLPLASFLPRDVRKVFVHHELRFVRNERYLQSLHLTPSEQQWEQQVKAKEIEDLKQYDAIITLSEQDKRTLEREGINRVPIHVSPAAINATLRTYTSWNGRIIFIGGHAHIPNKEGLDWFAQKVLPLLGGQQMGQQVEIIGGGWPEAYTERYGIKRLGFVERLADVASDTIEIVPILTGSGMRMKILEAAAMSIPFITTTVGVEGLAFKNEEDCLVADTPEDFARGLERLTRDEALRKRLADHAHSVFLNNYSAEQLARVRDDVYKSLFTV